MKLVLFLAADYANITGDGKLNVMGIFRVINSVQFPAKLASMHLIIKLTPDLGEYASRDLFVKLRDPDGNQLLEISGQIDVPKPGSGLSPEVNVILELKDVPFPKPGPYQFVVYIDKEYKDDILIMVNLIEPPSPTSV